MLHRTLLCHGKLSVRSSVSWNMSKIISRLINLGSSRSAESTHAVCIMSLLQWEHHKILAGIGVGHVALSAYKLRYIEWWAKMYNGIAVFFAIAQLSCLSSFYVLLQRNKITMNDEFVHL